MTRSKKRASFVTGLLLLLVSIILMFIVSPALQTEAYRLSRGGGGGAMEMQEKAHNVKTAGYLAAAVGLVFLLVGLIGQVDVGQQRKQWNEIGDDTAEASGKKTCTICGHDNPLNSKFCGNCGAALETIGNKDL
ncbi:MAG: zinc ribbon domain-containing protein [Candidatus Zixiibacteriota bacterium]